MLYIGTRFTLGVNGQVQKCLPPYSFFLVDRHDDRLERGRIHRVLGRGAHGAVVSAGPDGGQAPGRAAGGPRRGQPDGDDGQRRGGGGGARCGTHPATAAGGLRPRAASSARTSCGSWATPATASTRATGGRCPSTRSSGGLMDCGSHRCVLGICCRPGAFAAAGAGAAEPDREVLRAMRDQAHDLRSAPGRPAPAWLRAPAEARRRTPPARPRRAEAGAAAARAGGRRAAGGLCGAGRRL